MFGEFLPLQSLKLFQMHFMFGVFAFGWAPSICHYLRISKRDWDKLTLKDKVRNEEDPCIYGWRGIS
jgi:hypothetical protein